MWRLIVVSLVAVAACKSGPEVATGNTLPTLPEETFAIVTQSLTDVDLKYTGVLETSDEAVKVEKAVWEFVVDGTVTRSGETPVQRSAEAGQQLTFELTEHLTYVKDGSELKAMSERGGSLLLALRGVLVVHLGKDGRRAEIAFAKSREVRTPRLPRFKMMEFEAGRFSDSEVQAVFHLGVTNSNPFPISLSGIDYTVKLGGKEVNRGSIGAGEQVSAASTGVFDVTATLNEDTHGKEATKLVKSRVVPYELGAQLRTSLSEEAIEQRGEIRLTSTK